MESKRSRIMAALCYMELLIIIPALAAKHDRFAMFHFRQGVVILILSVLTGVMHVLDILPFAADMLNWILMVYSIIGIAFSIRGEAKYLPGFKLFL